MTSKAQHFQEVLKCFIHDQKKTEEFRQEINISVCLEQGHPLLKIYTYIYIHTCTIKNNFAQLALTCDSGVSSLLSLSREGDVMVEPAGDSPGMQPGDWKPSWPPTNCALSMVLRIGSL